MLEQFRVNIMHIKLSDNSNNACCIYFSLIPAASEE